MAGTETRPYPIECLFYMLSVITLPHQSKSSKYNECTYLNITPSKDKMKQIEFLNDRIMKK